MSTHATVSIESTDTLDARDVRALTEYLTVLPEASGRFQVVSQSGSSYTVDARRGTCTCPDHVYRDVRCKHLRRVAFATGERPVPADVPGPIDEHLGRHVDGDGLEPVVLADGGQVVDGPEYSRHVEPVEQGGEPYVRCEACGAELLEALGGRDELMHREDCPAAV